MLMVPLTNIMPWPRHVIIPPKVEATLLCPMGPSLPNAIRLMAIWMTLQARMNKGSGQVTSMKVEVESAERDRVPCNVLSIAPTKWSLWWGTPQTIGPLTLV